MSKEEYNYVYPLPCQDDIDKWLFKEFGIMAGACSSVKELEYNVAREVAEKAMEHAKEQMMKDAVEARFTLLDGFCIDRELYKNYNVGGKYKLIVIKED